MYDNTALINHIEKRKQATILENAYRMAENKGALLLDTEFMYWDCLVVVAEWQGSFVTWKTNGNGFSNGHYLASYDEAMADFNERLNG